MSNKKTQKILIVIAAAVILLGTLVMFWNKDDKTSTSTSEMPEANAITGEITHNMSIEQNFKCNTNTISEIAIVFNRMHMIDTEEVKEEVNVIVELLDGDNVLLRQGFECNDIEDQHRTFIKASSPIEGVKNKELTLKIYSDCNTCTGLKVMMQENNKNIFKYDGMTIHGTLCYTVSE